MVSDLDFLHEEWKKVFLQLNESIVKETHRGAIIIATTVVQNYFIDLVKSDGPRMESNNKQKEFDRKVYNYPGPLSSFNGLIHLAYAFGRIDQHMFAALNELRSLRNDAAHSVEQYDFTVADLEIRLFKVFDVKPDFSKEVQEVSLDALLTHKKSLIQSIIEESELEEQAKVKMMEEFFYNEDTQEAMLKGRFHWMLAHGIPFLCGFLRRQFEETSPGSRFKGSLE